VPDRPCWNVAGEQGAAGRGCECCCSADYGGEAGEGSGAAVSWSWAGPAAARRAFPGLTSAVGAENALVADG
jgi:hypothetical protein